MVKKKNQYVSEVYDLNNEDNVSICLKDGYVKQRFISEQCIWKNDIRRAIKRLEEIVDLLENNETALDDKVELSRRRTAFSILFKKIRKCRK